MSRMSSSQRVRAAIAGQAVDKVPVTAWIHFGSEHLPPEETAALHCRFAQAYQPDLLKVHADYRLTVNSEHDLRSADDLVQMGRSAAASPCFVLQKKCISLVLDSPLHNSLVMDTVFSPFQNLLRNIGRDQLPFLLQHQQQTHDTLARITEAVCEHLQWLKTRGVDTCFFATHVAIAEDRYSGLARERHGDIVEQWIQPFDTQVLAAASGMTRILHAHGQGLVLQQLSGYEFDVLHVSTELPGNPSLKTLRQWTPKCLMGGLNELDFAGLSLTGLHSSIAAAMESAGQCAAKKTGFILAPGCSLPPHTPARLLQRLLKGDELPA